MIKDYGELIAECRVWVMAEDETIAGVIVLIPEPYHLLVYYIAVRPELQGTGIGRRLMAFAKHQARDDGYQCIALYTYERMPENINFYEGLRFERCDRSEHPTRPGLWVVYLRKPIS